MTGFDIQNLQTLARLAYPPRCVSCGDMVQSDFGLCGACWGETPFIGGLVCEICGVPLPGEAVAGETLHCDECLTYAHPWQAGRAALLYRGNARRMVLALKHGDRQEIVRPAAGWLAGAAGPLLQGDMVVAPVPLHWSRLLRRRYNQAALLAYALARKVGLPCCPDLLVRIRRTILTDGLGVEQRFATMDAAISAHPRRVNRLRGRAVLIVDDVMTSGATFAACARACLQAGAQEVRVVALARVAKQAWA